MSNPQHSDLVVIGGGPGGYSAAFRAADLGKSVTLVDRRATLGGVCLNVGCIPSKALLHVAEVIESAATANDFGLHFGAPSVNLSALRGWKDKVVTELTSGLAGLARRRKVTVIEGSAAFASPNEIAVTLPGGSQSQLTFDHAIIATGSEPIRPAFLPEDPRILDSTGALALTQVPDHLVVLGGGIIGLEMAQVYHALGSRITVIEMADQIIPGADKALVAPLTNRIKTRYDLRLGCKLTDVRAETDALHLTLEGQAADDPIVCDALLVAVGRQARPEGLNLTAAGLTAQSNGQIATDGQMRTSQAKIFAIGDVRSGPMLAHKAVHEGKVAAEAACGEASYFDALTIPSVAYTTPEIAWAGLTETEAKAQGIDVEISTFPWAASGRARTQGAADGLTRLLTDPETGRILGIGITGTHAGELLAEGVLAIEMGADAADLALTIHPHPTLSETLAFAAEAREGTLTDL
ncbi:dihydrolipoyl dehydrogenase [Tritonibacter horizontis]|uniref:Dihydrolipoyl dehydrogenase n=1 Tax=Tritonibacter horizontis TaxID=1768241 RepID=A0A132BW48_9RHOB|nr:dihydrolipoyl dehydrogenase [Tritonibacter horizontis]KUP91950.1 dihydrolipoyl dehydrogenase [Tritonibacter horizontis]